MLITHEHHLFRMSKYPNVTETKFSDLGKKTTL